MILSSQHPESWDYKPEPPHPAAFHSLSNFPLPPTPAVSGEMKAQHSQGSINHDSNEAEPRAPCQKYQLSPGTLYVLRTYA